MSTNSNQNLFLSAMFALTLFSNASYAEESKWGMAEHPKYVVVGVGFDQSDAYSGSTLELQSPAISYQGRVQNEFSLVLTESSMSYRNTLIDKSTDRYKNVSMNSESVGIRWRAIAPSRNYSTYFQVAGVHLDADKDVAQFDHPNWGMRLAFGVESLVEEHEGRATSVFIQDAITTGLGRANQLAHEPDIFNGNSLSVGVRMAI